MHEFILKHGLRLVTTIVLALVLRLLYNYLLAPILNLVTGGIDVAGKYLVLSGDIPVGTRLFDARESGAILLEYGNFIVHLWSMLIWLPIAWISLKFYQRSSAS